ncbi:MAG: GNAT family N-acetyltransferase [Saccharofermentanales bacterium]
MDFTIRKAQKSDTDGILYLLKQIDRHHHDGRPDIFKCDASKYSAEELENIFNDDDKPVYVAVDEDMRVLGYVFCIFMTFKDNSLINDHKTLYIDDFCIDENFRKQNIGKALFNRARELAVESGVYNIELNVWEFNEGAMRFYEKCGFVTQKRRMEIII